MFILSYVLLVICISNYVEHSLNVAKVFYTGKGNSGVKRLWLGNLFLCATIYFSSVYGWN